jgi:hypothetical protein
MTIRPNPAGSSATIDLTLASPEAVTVALYQSDGSRVRMLFAGMLGAGGHRFAVETAGLPAGLYFCRMVTVKGSESVPVVVGR